MTPEEMVLADLVMCYVREINAIHRKYAPLLRAAPEPKAVFDACRQELDQARRQYLAQGKRSCNNGIFNPPRFANLEDPSVVFQTEIEGKKGMVTALAAGSLDFRFALRQQKGEWRISSLFQRYHSADRLVERQWQRAEL